MMAEKEDLACAGVWSLFIPSKHGIHTIHYTTPAAVALDLGLDVSMCLCSMS